MPVSGKREGMAGRELTFFLPQGFGRRGRLGSLEDRCPGNKGPGRKGRKMDKEDPTDMLRHPAYQGYPDPRRDALAELGERVLAIQKEKRRMLAEGVPGSGVNHWVQAELFDAIRSLGLLDEEGGQS
jgi:hypothetical protein